MMFVGFMARRLCELFTVGIVVYRNSNDEWRMVSLFAFDFLTISSDETGIGTAVQRGVFWTLHFPLLIFN